MAEIELGTLSDRLSDDEVDLVQKRLAAHLGEDFDGFPDGDTSASGTMADDLEEDPLAEFMDRLDSFDLGCEYYLPLEFDGKVDCGDFCVASLYTLADVLEEMMDDLDIEDPDDDVDDSEEDLAGDLEILQSRLRGLWRIFYDAVTEAIDTRLALMVRR